MYKSESEGHPFYFWRAPQYKMEWIISHTQTNPLRHFIRDLFHLWRPISSLWSLRPKWIPRLNTLVFSKLSMTGFKYKYHSGMKYVHTFKIGTSIWNMPLNDYYSYTFTTQDGSHLNILFKISSVHWNVEVSNVYSAFDFREQNKYVIRNYFIRNLKHLKIHVAK